ncbi:MAG: 5-(carboxyamino)imidazole ribonucleotide synthase [Vulcanimicrobiaceae bacterium]
MNFTTIGILGGGQLGRMLTLEAKRMGYHVITLDPVPDSPCGQVADDQIIAAYDDAAAVSDLGERSDVVTYEFENIPRESVERLEAEHRVVRPDADVLRITQDRIFEKTFLREIGIPVPDFGAVTKGEEMIRTGNAVGFPAVVKLTTGGYDGKGQWVVRSRDQAREALAEAQWRPLIFERMVPFDKELAIITARNAQGEMVTFPVTENVHDHGVLSTTIVPARIPEKDADRAREIALEIGRALEIVGAFAVEFFWLESGEILVNEIAPRVHNSGHYSLDATQISQHEAHIRAICDLPLVEPHMHVGAAVMVNILGNGTGDYLDGIEDVLREPDLKLHLYGKTEAALRRKMGHFTVLASDVAQGLAIAERARAHLRWSDRRHGIAV